MAFGSNVPSTGTTYSQLVNDEPTNLVICMPVYSDAPGGVRMALGDGSAKSKGIGVVIDVAIKPGATGNVLRVGVVTATTAQWDAVCGTSGGLAYGTLYYLSTTVAGALVTSSASGVPVIFGLGPTVGAIVTSGSGGSVGPGTPNALPKFTGASTVGDSGITDDGAAVTLTSRKLQIGGVPVPTQNKAYFSSIDPACSTMFWITDDSVLHVGFGGNNEALPVVLRCNATFAMGVGGTATGGCIDINVQTSKASGTGTLTNQAILSNASGGDVNYCFLSQFGDFRMSTTASTTLGLTTCNTLSTTGLADFSGSSALKLSQNITSPKNTIPGDSANTPQLSLGVTTLNDGTGIQIKNTNAAQTLSGIDLLADTTVAANQSTGLFMTRGASGGGGANGAHPSGIALIGNAGSIVVGTAQGDLAVFNQLTGGAIVFGADASAFGFQARLAQDGGFQFKNYYGAGGERLSASGAASVILGNTYATGAGTNLTLASGNFDGQVKTFTATSGTGQVTPAAFGNGTKMTWSAGGQSCTFHWDATGAKWWLVANVGMTVV